MQLGYTDRGFSVCHGVLAEHRCSRSRRKCLLSQTPISIKDNLSSELTCHQSPTVFTDQLYFTERASFARLCSTGAEIAISDLRCIYFFVNTQTWMSARLARMTVRLSVVCVQTLLVDSLAIATPCTTAVMAGSARVSIIC